ncbi:hypothetical protein H8K32_14910 [Undibacterium jejuense]|uniref:Uncharacterized protein n=1 Tax=Undibacterium jejuense TaxID=1344949 RepID=A0A923HRI8_9BURK|nr:hypothetical protein [Undibacterium jejuense]MBC3863393.1 hypothetical protein [Undibacterium jejuense]
MLISSSFSLSVTPTATKSTNSVGSQPQSFVIADELTPADKSLIVASSGSLDPVSSTGEHLGNPFATRIALDRAGGSLTGEVDKSYINTIINQQKAIPSEAAGRDAIIPFSILDKALAYLDQKNATSGTNINTTA